MSVNSRSFLSEAERLSATASDEAGYRTVTSRAYYSVYHLASAWHRQLPQPGIPLPNCGTHKNLVHQLEHPTLPVNDGLAASSKSLGYQLKGLLYRRHKADYELDQHLTAHESTQAVAKSQVIHQQFTV